jgi:hypothetical protein
MVPCCQTKQVSLSSRGGVELVAEELAPVGSQKHGNQDNFEATSRNSWNTFFAIPMSVRIYLSRSIRIRICQLGPELTNSDFVPIPVCLFGSEHVNSD